MGKKKQRQRKSQRRRSAAVVTSTRSSERSRSREARRPRSVGRREAADEGLSWDTLRERFDALADTNEDWQGIPVPIPDIALQLHDRHPLADAYRQIDGAEMTFVCGGPTFGDDEYVHEEIVNSWFAWKLNAEVQIWRATFRDKPAKFFAIKIPRSPDSSMDRFGFWMRTLGASDAWDVDAEHVAREKLRGMVTERQWRHYDLTGAFLETSPRSRLTYVFRRLRPTLALTPRWPWFRTQHDSMRFLAVLCMHPIGYYQRSWAGCMVPTDDVIAHLMFMRGDEKGFWKQANQHEARTPEAGL